MKESIDHAENGGATEQQPCSEKKCVTCFENRGCIYEQYLHVATPNIEKYLLGNRRDVALQQWGKQL